MSLNKIIKNIDKMKTESVAIISRSTNIKNKLNEIEGYDDLYDVENDFRKIAEWANNMVDLCLETYDEFEE